MNILEVLYNTKASLSDPMQHFDFGVWGRCTCGHIYYGVNNRFGIEKQVTDDETKSDYSEAITAVAVALGYKLGRDIKFSALTYISNFTRITHQVMTGFPGTISMPRYHRLYTSVDREAAIKVIDLAIKMIEKEQEKARLQILQDLDFQPTTIIEEETCLAL